MSDDIIDRIDSLVDEQLAGGEPETGYSFGDPQYPRCPHCDRYWHGLPVTNRIADMYSWGRYDQDYSYADDDSGIICEGSDFIGPRKPTSSGWGRLLTALDRIGQSFTELTASIPVIEWPTFSFGNPARAPWVIFRDSPRRGGQGIGGQLVTFWDEHWNPTPVIECTGPLPEVDIKFGPQNWHLEFQYIPTSLQFPASHLRNDPPARAVRHHWQALTAPDFPIPKSPGYNFSEYDTDITHGPERSRKSKLGSFQ